MSDASEREAGPPASRSARRDGHVQSRLRVPSIRCRPLARLVVGVLGVAVLPATASAHGEPSHSGGAVGFALALALPILAGGVGGLAAVRVRSAADGTVGGRTGHGVFGFLLVGLGATLAITAGTRSVSLTVAGATVGVSTALWFTARTGPSAPGRRRRADLAFGGVFAHRMIEGVLLGALYSSGAAIGLLAAVVIAVHATAETASVGGLYASNRLRALGTVALVQVGFAVGAVLGVTAGEAVPLPIEVLSLGFAGGVLLIVGGTESKRSSHVARRSAILLGVQKR